MWLISASHQHSIVAISTYLHVLSGLCLRSRLLWLALLADRSLLGETTDFKHRSNRLFEAALLCFMRASYLLGVSRQRLCNWSKGHLEIFIGLPIRSLWRRHSPFVPILHQLALNVDFLALLGHLFILQIIHGWDLIVDYSGATPGHLKLVRCYKFIPLIHHTASYRFIKLLN